MPTFVPAATPSVGSITGISTPWPIIDSTYGALGGSYGVAGWGYGGFIIPIPTAALPAPGAFTSKAAQSIGSMTARATTPPGEFVPR